MLCRKGGNRGEEPLPVTSGDPKLLRSEVGQLRDEVELDPPAARKELQVGTRQVRSSPARADTAFGRAAVGAPSSSWEREPCREMPQKNAKSRALPQDCKGRASAPRRRGSLVGSREL